MPLIVLLAALLLLPATAQAAAGTARVVTEEEGDPDIREDIWTEVVLLRYQGTPGRSSDLTVRFLGKGRAVLSDPGGIRAGSGCRRQSGVRVLCNARGRFPVGRLGTVLRLGDRNDAVRMRGRPRTGGALLVAGAGDDRVHGSRGSDTLDGGAGDDVLRGARGNDSFWSSRRDGADLVSGGRGRDELSYLARTAGVRADLEGDADDGGAGEGDRVLPDVENLLGGDGADELTGGPGANRLVGGMKFAQAADVLRGGGGPDALYAEAPGTVLEGGAGDDYLGAGQYAVMDGGPGRDALSGGYRPQVLARDGEGDELSCFGVEERALVDAFDAVLNCPVERQGAAMPRIVFGLGPGFVDPFPVRRLARSGRQRTVRVACSIDMPSPCAVRVVVRDRVGTLLDRRRTVAPDSFGDVRFRLPRGRSGPFTLRLEGTDAAGAAMIHEEADVR